MSVAAESGPGGIPGALSNSSRGVTPICKLTIGGSTFDDNSELMKDISHIDVHQSLYMPAMFVIRVKDVDFKYFGKDGITIGSEVKITLTYDESSASKPMIVGEITAIEMDANAELHTAMPTLTIRGYDRAHRLQRARYSRSFQNVKISDLVSKLAGEGGLSASIEAETQEVYPVLIQNNETDWEFLWRLINRLGLELVVEDKKLILRKRPDNFSGGLKLKWRDELVRINTRSTSSSQVSNVTVRGTSSGSQPLPMGTATSSNNHPKSQAGNPQNPFGNAEILAVERPVSTQREAELVAKATLDAREGRYMYLDGTCIGNPDLRPGTCVDLDEVGAFNGVYYITATFHKWKRRSYQTDFEANGRQTNTLIELTRQYAPPNQTGNVNGLVIAKVSNNRDPENYGRVKITFPWLGEKVESDWIQYSAPFAGYLQGFYFLPDVGQQVLVGFEQGSIDRPYILSSLWNKTAIPPKTNDYVLNSDGSVKYSYLRSRKGHTFWWNDGPEKPFIKIFEYKEICTISIESDPPKITIENAQGNIELKAPAGEILLDAKSIKQKASMEIANEALTIEHKGSAEVKISSSAGVKVHAPDIKVG